MASALALDEEVAVLTHDLALGVGLHAADKLRPSWAPRGPRRKTCRTASGTPWPCRTPCRHPRCSPSSSWRAHQAGRPRSASSPSPSQPWKEGVLLDRRPVDFPLREERGPRLTCLYVASDWVRTELGASGFARIQRLCAVAPKYDTVGTCCPKSVASNRQSETRAHGHGHDASLHLTTTLLRVAKAGQRLPHLNERQLSQNWPAPLYRNAEGARFDEPRALFSGQGRVPPAGSVAVITGGPCRRGRPCSS